MAIQGDSGNDLASDASLSLDLNPPKISQKVKFKNIESKETKTPKTVVESGLGSWLLSSNSIRLKKAPGAKHSRGTTMATIKDNRANLPSKSGCKVAPRLIHQTLYDKYEKAVQNTYNVNIVNDVIVNSKSLITAAFKDYLIYDDVAENLSKYYKKADAQNRLINLSNCAYKQITPNYFAIEERQFLFKNIEKKKKAAVAKRTEGRHKKSSTAASRGFMEEFIRKATIPARTVARMDMIGLLDKFIDRDSLSLIHRTNCANIDLNLVSKEIASTAAKPKVLKLNNFVFLTKGESKPAVKARCPSQECIANSSKLTKNSEQVNGRVTELGHYKPREELKKASPCANPGAKPLRSITPLIYGILKFNKGKNKERQARDAKILGSASTKQLSKPALALKGQQKAKRLQKNCVNSIINMLRRTPSGTGQRVNLMTAKTKAAVPAIERAGSALVLKSHKEKCTKK